MRVESLVFACLPQAWIQLLLTSYGIECMMEKPADIPGTQKNEVYIADARDARLLAMH